jgi:hypothetical protein
MSGASEYEYFANKRPDKVYGSSSFDTITGKMRYISKTCDQSEHHQFIRLKGEIVLQVSPGSRHETVARIYEDEQGIDTLVIQRFTIKDGSPHKTSFSFTGEAALELMQFIAVVKELPLSEKGKFQLSSEVLQHYLLTDNAKRQLILDNEDLVRELVRNNVTKTDIVALGFRKEQLSIFRRFLESPEFFAEIKKEWSKHKDEDVWQEFFERNPWIFGYGLNYIWLSGLNNRKLEQVVSGFDFSSAGKRTDALMRTRGFISSLCFVEIKKHSTELLDTRGPYRPECWRVSDEIAGSIAQVQKTVQKTVRDLQSRIRLKDKTGAPTDEEVFLYRPRSYVVAGCLTQFNTQHGINEEQFSSFELFRQGLIYPELITFDELYERAKYIVEHAEQNS